MTCRDVHHARLIHLARQLRAALSQAAKLALFQTAINTKQFCGGGELLSLEGPADDVDESVGEVGEVAEGFMLDGFAVAIGAAEEDGDVGFAFVLANDSGYVHATVLGAHTGIVA